METTKIEIDNIEELWNSAVEILKVEGFISSQQINCWFPHITPIEIQKNALILSTPNQFTSQWIKKNYLSNIISALSSLNPNISNILFKTVESLAPTPPKKQTTKKDLPLMSLPFSTPQPSSQNQQSKKATHITISLSSITSPSQKNKKIKLNPYYTFKNYIIHSQNKVATEACKQITSHIGSLYNPLLIYGSTGTGKTHLTQALCHHLTQQRVLSVRHIPSEHFANHFISALRNKSLKSFKNEHRKLDLLIIDDIQFLSGKSKTCEEFFHIFNDLYNKEKQIIITSDRKPTLIPDLQQQLVSRFLGGLTIQIKSPNLCGKKELIDHKLQQASLNLSPHLGQLIAQAVDGNIRSIEGIIKKIKAYHTLHKKMINEETLLCFLRPFNQNKQQQNIKKTLPEITQTIAQFYKIETDDIFSKKRTRKVLWARYMTLLILSKNKILSPIQICQKFSFTQVSYLNKTYTKAIELSKKNQTFKENYNDIFNKI